MCASLYAYHFGAIDFLELIKRFEEMLELHQTEAADVDAKLQEGEADRCKRPNLTDQRDIA